MRPISPAIEQRLALLFPPDRQEQARQILLEECGENIPCWQSAGLDRLRCAVLKVSGGDLGRLQHAVDVAKSDFRDVLMWAGLGEPDQWLAWFPKQKW